MGVNRKQIKLLNSVTLSLMIAFLPLNFSSAKTKSRKRSAQALVINESDVKVDSRKEKFEEIISQALGPSASQVKTLTLREAVEYAIKDNIEYKTSRIDLAISNSSFELKKYQFYFPTFQTVGTAYQHDDRFLGLTNEKTTSALNLNLVGEVPYTGLKYTFTPIGFTTSNEDLFTDSHTSTMGLLIEFPLLNAFGPVTNKLTYRNDNLDLEIAKENVAQSRMATVSGVVGNYWQLYYATHQLFTQQINLNISMKTYRAVTGQIAAGRMARAESSRAKLNLDLARSSHAAAISNFLSAHTDFIAVLGYAPTEVDVVLLPLPLDTEVKSMIESRLDLNNVNALYEQALKKQPSLIALEKELEKSKNVTTIAKYTQYPDLSIVAKTSMEGESENTLNEALKDGQKGELRENYVGLKLSWSYALSGNDTYYTAAKLTYTKNKYLYEKLKREIKAKIISGVKQIQSLQKAYDFSKEATVSAEKSYIYDVEKFDSGLVNQTVLLETQKTLIETRIFEITSLLALKNSILNLDLVMGDMSSYISDRSPSSVPRRTKKGAPKRRGAR